MRARVKTFRSSVYEPQIPCGSVYNGTNGIKGTPGHLITGDGPFVKKKMKMHI